MRAKTFMQVGIGVLTLTVAYHLGVESAGAQTPSVIQAAGCYDVPGIVYDVKVAVINRVVYLLGGSGAVPQYADPIPGSARPIAVGLQGVILDDGEIWSHQSGSWQLQGTFPALGPTPTQPTSFGALKARYH